MAFRIGKSVMLNFGNDLEPVFIFVGLAFLLLIGPLLRWYVTAMLRVNFKFSKYYYLEFLPFLVMFLASFMVTREWYESQNESVIIVFASFLIFIYLHFAFYIFISNSTLRKVKKSYSSELLTKHQKAIFSWLHFLILGFVVIWFSYFLNIIENMVPYITGPIMYSVVIYFLSLKAFQLKITDIDGGVFKKNDDLILFAVIKKLIYEDRMFLEPDVSLSGIAKLTGKTNQKVSEVVNQYAQQNFNDFVNFSRIEEAKKELLSQETENYTIASIAFGVGFSSLSSFNSSFKKFVGMTPSEFRKK